MQKLATFLSKSGLKEAAANFGWLFVERAGRFVLGALVGLLVARYLGPARLGTLSYCTALVTLLCYLPAFGLDAVVKRGLLEAPDKTAELLASSFGLRLGVGVFTFAGASLIAASGWGFAGEEAGLFIILGAIFFQPALFLPEIWLQAHLRAKVVVVVQLSALAAASALRLGLIAAGASLTAFAWATVLEVVLGVVGIYHGARRAGLRFPLSAARWRTMKALAGEAWPLMFASLAIFIYIRIDEIMLRQMAGPSEVGIYAAAAKLSELWYFIPMALASSVLPALVRSREQGAEVYRARLQQYYDVSALAAYTLSIPIALAAPWLVRITYGEAFAAAGPILAVHIWSSIFVFIGVARGQWLVNERLQGFYLGATCAGATVNILLNLLCIPRWGGLGAAYATVISYALASWIASYFHPAVRATGAMQTRALLVPLLGWRYFRR